MTKNTLLTPGDIIIRILNIKAAYHFGIVIENDEVIDYGADAKDGSHDECLVTKKSLSDFVAGENDFYILTKYPFLTESKRNDAINRAKEMVNKPFNDGYNMSENNCEKFVCYCYGYDTRGFQRENIEGKDVFDNRILGILSIDFKLFSLTNDGTFMENHFGEEELKKIGQTKILTLKITEEIDFMLSTTDGIENQKKGIIQLLDQHHVKYKIGKNTSSRFEIFTDDLTRNLAFEIDRYVSKVTLARNGNVIVSKNHLHSFMEKIDIVVGIFTWLFGEKHINN